MSISIPITVMHDTSVGNRSQNLKSIIDRDFDSIVNFKSILNQIYQVDNRFESANRSSTTRYWKFLIPIPSQLKSPIPVPIPAKCNVTLVPCSMSLKRHFAFFDVWNLEH